MGYDISGFVLTQEPHWEALQNLPAGLGVKGHRHKTKPLWLLDVWECFLGDYYPMICRLPEDYQPFVELPSETETVLGQLRAIAVALREVDPLHRLTDISWSASISALCGVEATFFSANDESLNMAMRWNAGHLQAMRISTGYFLITNSSPDGLVIQRVISLEEDPPWQCLPEVDEALREIPGVAVGETLTVECNAFLHSNAIALWPEEAAFAKEMLGIGSFDSEPNEWSNYVVEFERACPPPEALRPDLDLPSILKRAQAEAAELLQTNRKFDAQEPLAVLGFNDIYAVNLVRRMQEIYFVKIPEAQLVAMAELTERSIFGQPLKVRVYDELLTFQQIAELILSAASPTLSPPPAQQSPVLNYTGLSAKNWRMIVIWIAVALPIGFFAALFFLGFLGVFLHHFGVNISPYLYPLLVVLWLLIVGVIFVLGLRGLLPGTRIRK